MLAFAHVTLHPLVPLVVCLLIAFAFAYRDIRLSTLTLLLLEASSVSLIVLQMLFVVFHGGRSASFGFVAIYDFVSLGAPVYLRRLGELRPGHIVVAAFTLGLLLILAIGSVYPVPPQPTNTFPYVFAIYFLAGVALL